MLVALCTLAALAVQEPASFGEGALENQDAFETSERAEALLADADRLWSELRAGSVAEPDRERTWNAVFDAWHDAVEACSADEWVRPDPARFALGRAAALRPDDDAARRAEGAECALLRRLAALDRARRAAWTARFEARAEAELARAGDDAARWRSVERGYPATAHAARAALRLADVAFAEGRVEPARAWLDRAALHAELLGGAAGPAVPGGFGDAVRRRRDALATLDPPRAPPRETLGNARGFGKARIESYRFAPGVVPGRDQLDARLREAIEAELRRVRPGAAWLSSGRMVVQSESLLAVFPAAATEPPALIPLAALVEGLRGAAPASRAAPLSGSRATPVAVGDELIVAPGRAAPGAGPALVRIALGAGVLAPEPAPVRRWAVAGGLHVDERGSVRELPPELSLAGLELHAGPATFADRIVWLAREMDAAPAPATWAVAFDLASGLPLWKRRLAAGRPGPRPAADPGRFRALAPVDDPALHLLARGGRVFAGTGAGFGVLLDGADGRLLWSVKSRRRYAEDPGWLGATALDAGDGTLAWPPRDSDRGYRLRAAPDLDDRGILVGAPFERAELAALLHAEGSRVLAVHARGAEQRLAWIDLASGERVLSCALPDGQRFADRALVEPARVVVATERGLALFDRERELLLLDRIDLGAPVSDVLAARDGIVALGAGVVWRVGLR